LIWISWLPHRQNSSYAFLETVCFSPASFRPFSSFRPCEQHGQVTEQDSAIVNTALASAACYFLRELLLIARTGSDPDVFGEATRIRKGAFEQSATYLTNFCREKYFFSKNAN